jgi:hypothetical protein
VLPSSRHLDAFAQKRAADARGNPALADEGVTQDRVSSNRRFRKFDDHGLLRDLVNALKDTAVAPVGQNGTQLVPVYCRPRTGRGTMGKAAADS